MGDEKRHVLMAKYDGTEPVEMCRFLLDLPYDTINRWTEVASAQGMALDAYVVWAVEKMSKLRIVPLIGVCH
ncbi:MAG: hypothetical protein Q4E13_11860 [Clostridia bacterium]|nr:hypothetical protein [Clostridia bacterium]